jgi:hypothetical protein
MNTANKNWYDVTDEYLRQSTDDLAFFGMSEEEFDERANRLAFKALNGIEDAETRAADERLLKNTLLFEGFDAYEKLLNSFLEDTGIYSTHKR